MSTYRRHIVPPELVREIERILEERLGRFGLEKVEVRGGEDHYGEPAIFVEVWYRLSEEPIDVDAQARAELAVIDRLVEVGEDRFPYFRHHYAEGQEIAGMTDRRRRRKAR